MKNKAIRKPDFFIVGAPKCGTTAMTDYLTQHPDIFIPDVKELHFFGSDLKKSQKYNRELDAYLAWFKVPQNYVRIGESSTWYLYSKVAAKEIKEFNPEANVIIMIRNPVEVVYSLHSQLIYAGFENLYDFQAALDAEEDRKQGNNIPKGAHLVDCLFYTDAVKYTDQIRRYLEVFGEEKVHIIIFDDFKQDTPKSYENTLRYLEVNTDYQPDFKIVNPNKQVHSTAFRDLYQSPPSAILKLARTTLPRWLRTSIMVGIRNANTKFTPRPPMDPELKRRLKSEFTTEVESLSKLLDRDLTHWTKE